MKREELRLELLKLLRTQMTELSNLLSEEAMEVLINILKAYSRPKDYIDNQQILQRIMVNMFHSSTEQFRVYVTD